MPERITNIETAQKETMKAKSIEKQMRTEEEAKQIEEIRSQLGISNIKSSNE